MARTELTVNDKGGLDIRVVLSRRNLLAMLHKLDMKGSGREIHNNDVWLHGKQAPPWYMLVLNCENDDEHYGRREHPPGVMHSDTEEFISRED